MNGLAGVIYMLSGNTSETVDQYVCLYKEIYHINGFTKAIWNYFKNLILDLIKYKFYQLDTTFIMDVA
jgi:hypothetical protein